MFLGFDQSSSSFFFFSRITNALRLGAGIIASSPFTDFQITSFKARSGAASSFLKLKLSDCLLLLFTATLRLLISTLAGMALKGNRSGVAVKHSYMGNAAASYWLMGGKPNISSMVRNTPDV